MSHGRGSYRGAKGYGADGYGSDPARMVVNNDGYINKVFHGGGTFKLTVKELDTPYVIPSARLLVHLRKPQDF